MRITLLLSLLFMVSCASNNETDSDKIVGEFKQAGQKVGNGLKKSATNIEDSMCDSFSSDPESCKK